MFKGTSKKDVFWESFPKCGWLGWLIPKQGPNPSRFGSFYSGNKDLKTCRHTSSGLDTRGLGRLNFYAVSEPSDYPSDRFDVYCSMVSVLLCITSTTTTTKNHPENHLLFSQISQKPWGGWMGKHIWENSPKK